MLLKLLKGLKKRYPRTEQDIVKQSLPDQKEMFLVNATCHKTKCQFEVTIYEYNSS